MARAASMTPPGPYVKVGWLGGYYKLKYFKTSDVLVTVTKDVKDHMIRQGWQGPPIDVISTFCEIDLQAQSLNRAQFDTPEKVPLLLALGRLHSDKALDVLLRALALVPGPYLWIAGEGPSRDELMRLTQKLGLTDRVRFLGWRTDRDSLLKTCDVCAYPSRAEPFGTVTIEAWANKVPLVTAASLGPKAIVRHRENGLIVPIDDVNALAAAIDEAITNKPLCAHMVKEGLRDYNARFTKAAVVKEYLKFYNSLL
jgi:glycosyltransferase involved in cell wall biosynthesis